MRHLISKTVICSSILLAACTAPDIPEPVQQAEAEAKVIIRDAITEEKQKEKPSGLIKFDGRFIGGNRKLNPHGMEFPKDKTIEITTARPMSLVEIMASIERQTGYYYEIAPSRKKVMLGESEGSVTGQESPNAVPVHYGPEPVSMDLESYEGPIGPFLRQVVSHFRKDYYFDGTNIRVFSETVKLHTVHAFKGKTEVTSDLSTSGNGGGQGGGDRASNDFATAREFELDFWAGLKSDVDLIIPDQYEVNVSEDKGSVVVVAPRWVHRELDQYFAAENARLSRNLHAVIRVISLEVEQSENLGFQLDALVNEIHALDSNFNLRAAGPSFTLPENGAPAFGITAATGKMANSKLLFDTIGRSGTIDAKTEMVQTISNYQSYSAHGIKLNSFAKNRKTTTVPGNFGTTSTEIVTGEIRSGISLSLFTVIHNDRDFTLDYSISASGNPTYQFYGRGSDSEIQLPEYGDNKATQRRRMVAGQRQVLASIMRESNTHNEARGLTGHNKGSEKTRQVFLVILEPAIDDSYARGAGWSIR